MKNKKIKEWAAGAAAKACNVIDGLSRLMTADATVKVTSVDGEIVVVAKEQDRMWIRVSSSDGPCYDCPLCGHCSELNNCEGLLDSAERWQEADCIVVHKDGRRTVVTGATAAKAERIPETPKRLAVCTAADLRVWKVADATFLTCRGREGFWYPVENRSAGCKCGSCAFNGGDKDVCARIEWLSPGTSWRHTLQGHLGPVDVAAPNGELIVSDPNIAISSFSLAEFLPQDKADAPCADAQPEQTAVCQPADTVEPEAVVETAVAAETEVTAETEVSAETVVEVETEVAADTTVETAVSAEPSEEPDTDKGVRVYRYRGTNMLTVPWSTGLYVPVPVEDGSGCEGCTFRKKCYEGWSAFDCNALLKADAVWKHYPALVVAGGPTFSAPNGFLESVNGDVDPSVREPLTTEELAKLAAEGRIDRVQSEPIDVLEVEEVKKSVDEKPVVYNVGNRAYMVAEGRLFYRSAAADRRSCDGCQVKECGLRNYVTPLLPGHCRNAANQRRIWKEPSLEGTENDARWYVLHGHNFVLQQDGSLLYYKNGYTHRNGGYSLDGFVKLKKG